MEVLNLGTGKIEVYHAKKEVILSAGSIDSPRLLMYSGIGDCAHLESLDIECVSNTPGIGKSFEDHSRFLFFSPPLINSSFPITELPYEGSGTFVFTDINETPHAFLFLLQEIAPGVKAIFVMIQNYKRRANGTVMIQICLLKCINFEIKSCHKII